MPQVPPVIDLDGEDMDGDPIPVAPPHHIWNALIPPDSLSATSLLIQFPDHSSSSRPTLSFHPSLPTHFTSPDEAGLDLTLAIIQTSPLPERSAIRRIREGLESTLASEFQSLHISLGFVDGLFPFWFAKCLTQMEVAESSARLWRASLRWLQRGESDPAEVEVHSQCVTRLNTLVWYTPLEQFRSAVLHGTDLAGFLGDNWLTDEHMNAAGDWINMRLGEDSHSRVLSTFFLGSLALNRSQHPTWNPIRPRKLDTLVRDGHVPFLMIPVHLHCHWTYLYVDLMNRSCIYFDSLDPDNFIAPDGVLELLDWWLASVLPLPEEEGLSEEDTRNFDATEQTDGHSCRVAVLSIMAHVALGEESWTQEGS
ncbi:Sentrin-specific protease 3 [Tulasnella sp. 424]|nr:Sentrin-specific protease 3 [Tulasnella sp. 424]KAG8964311.1 Sentrin-specific protease 3 [Tulasnella sp. 425]